MQIQRQFLYEEQNTVSVKNKAGMGLHSESSHAMSAGLGIFLSQKSKWILFWNFFPVAIQTTPRGIPSSEF